MKAVVVSSPGGYDQLTVDEVPEPTPGVGQVVIDIDYAGCNWGDTQIRAGTYSHPIAYPAIPGYEVAGTIAQIGPEVSDTRVGERVAAIIALGGYAERCVVPVSNLIRLPDAIGLDVAAAFPIQALTAYQMLVTIFRVQRGDTVLINAIGGGVGLFCTQLAVRMGARVIGTVGTPGKEKRPLEYGASSVIVTSSEDFEKTVLGLTGGAGVDLAIDSLGGMTLDRTFGVVRVLGHIINIGEAEAMPLTNIRERLMARSQTFTRLSLGKIDPTSRPWTDGIAYLLEGIREGWIDVPISKIFNLDQVAAMHELMESRHASGKLLLKVR